MAHLLDMVDDDAPTMLDAIQATSLLALIIAHSFLIRGCFKIKEEMPIQGTRITTKIDTVSEYLDELNQLISDFSDSMPSNNNTQTASSPMEVLLTSFMSSMTKQNHAPKESEWEVLPPNEDSTPPVEAQD